VALAVRSLAFGGGPGPAPKASTPVALETILLRSNDGRTLNDIAYALIGARAYKRALPFGRKAVLKATPGTLTEGYATFNLGYILLKLGRCRESLVYLRRALKLEPPQLHRYIRPRISQAERCVKRAASARAPFRSSGVPTGPFRAR